MNEETILVPEETTDPTGEPVTTPDETEAAATDDWSVTEEDNEISETMADLSDEEFVLEDSTETVQETVQIITIEEIQTIGSDIMHANLFGSFLICGTLVGLALLSKIYGT